ncbi:MAG: GNAT family N-acetyltransferase [Lachnospiraceae bacterium]|nr:GNAT family N-acetyltransferase [Lachnospiraceae bacterium]
MWFFGKKKNVDSDEGKIQYKVTPFMNLSDDEIAECSELFGNNYGVYNNLAKKPGKQIQMSVNLYKKYYYEPHYYIATARYDDKLIGQAIYYRNQIKGIWDEEKNNSEKKIMSWVVQLVVSKEFRQRGIASTLLRSIWGFSNDYAWGLATSNPCTVKTLESATFRQCKPKVILKHMPEIRALIQEIPFVNGEDIKVSNSSSQVDSKFFVQNTEYKDEDIIKRLGELRDGHEWLAFVFQSQDINHANYEKHFDEMVKFSEMKLRDAYTRMDMKSHGWAKNTGAEVDYIIKYGEGNKILDLGCGQGRHSLELASIGFNVKGIDFSEQHIENAKCENAKCGINNCEFECADIRFYNDKTEYDRVLCLYDVVGSFPEKKDNQKIIMTAYNHLKVNGYLILSVMNMELTSSLVSIEHKVNLKKNPRALAELKPSNTMQRTGDIFNPELLLIDTATSLVYRKEQFIDDSKLPAEYVIRDKRYTKDEICALIEECGFVIEQAQYVSAGHFETSLDATDIHAKEILIVAKKL